METERYPHYDGCTRDASPPHMPLGPREVPLLAYGHPPLKFARQHHKGHEDIPRHDAPGYGHYTAMRDVALSNSMKNLEQELALRSPVEHIALENELLIVRYHSQSKLSQQELADLQKATHFDKKELQQWYKGTKYQAHMAEFRAE